MLNGVDISNYQAQTPAGQDFYIMKASEGIGWVDSRLNQHTLYAESNKKLLGFYHFARPDLGNSGAAEADFFLSVIRPYIGMGVLCLDLEGSALTAGNYVSYAYDFIKRVRDVTGVTCVLYTTGAAIGNLATVCRTLNVGVWACSNQDYYDHAGVTTIMKQSTRNGIDYDLFYGDATTWNKYAVGSSQKQTKAGQKQTEAKKPLATIVEEVKAGKWGNGEERKQKLIKAGYSYDEVQRAVNASYKTRITKADKVYYVVQKGDTLTSIGKRYGSSVSQLVQWNGIKNKNLIFPGQRLRVK